MVNNLIGSGGPICEDKSRFHMVLGPIPTAHVGAARSQESCEGGFFIMEDMMDETQQNRTKTCPRCRETKPLNEFHRNASRYDGRACYCKKCITFYNKVYYASNREKHNAACRKSKAARPEVYKNRAKIYRTEHKEKRRIEKLRYLYNLTLSDYDAMMKNQDGACAICGERPNDSDKKLGVDHNHATNQIRGLLCNACNMAVGFLKDNPELCRNAALYLEKYELRGENE